AAYIELSGAPPGLPGAGARHRTRRRPRVAGPASGVHESPSHRPCERSAMKAMTIKEPGGPEVLEWTEVADPSPADGEVVVDVAASAVNRADVMQRMGLYPLAPGTSPYPGLEASGRISAV